VAWILPSIEHTLTNAGINCVVITNILLRSVHREKKRKLNSMPPLSLPLNLKWTPLNVKATATATATNKVTEVPLPEKIRNSRILVLGGTGRVGGSTATALSNFCPDLQILVAGRNRSVTVRVRHTHRL